MMATCISLAKYQTWFDMVGATRRVDIGVVRQEAKEAERVIESMKWDAEDALYQQLKFTFNEITQSRTYSQIPLRKFSRLLGEANSKTLESINLHLLDYELTLQRMKEQDELQTTFVNRLDELQQTFQESQTNLDGRLEALETGVHDRLTSLTDTIRPREEDPFMEEGEHGDQEGHEAGVERKDENGEERVPKEGLETEEKENEGSPPDTSQAEDIQPEREDPMDPGSFNNQPTKANMV